MRRGAVDIEIAAFYCVCDELLKSLNHQYHFQCRMSAAEVMAAALTAAAMRKPQFSQRISRHSPYDLKKSVQSAACLRCSRGTLKIYSADSFPVPVCRNIRIKLCEIYDDSML